MPHAGDDWSTPGLAPLFAAFVRPLLEAGVAPKKILNNIRVEIDKKHLTGPEPALKAVQNAAKTFSRRCIPIAQFCRPLNVVALA